MAEQRWSRPRSKLRLVAALAVGAVVFSLVYASAASLLVNSGDLAAASTTSRCDTDGVTSSYTTVAATIGADVVDVVDIVTLAGIADACFGRDFAVTLADGSVVKLAEERRSDVSSASFGGSANMRTLDFDFLTDLVPAISVVAPSGTNCCYIAIYDAP